MRRPFWLVMAAATALSTPAVGQSPDHRESAWDITAFGGLSQHLSSDRLRSALAFGLGLRRHVGARSGLTLEAAYLPLGSISASGPYRSLLDSTLFGTQSSYHGRKILRLGLGLDLPVTQGTVRPSLLVGAGFARFHSERRSIIVDSAGVVRSSDRFSGWTNGWTTHFGLALALPTVGPFQPALDSRVHGVAIKEAEAKWTVIPVLTMGITIIY